MILPFATLFPSSQKPIRNPYDLVPASDEETLLGSQDDDESCNRISYKRTLDASFWLTALGILSIAVTIRNLIVIQIYPQPSANYLEASFVRPYNGLERIPRNESSPSWPLSSIHYPDFVGSTEGPLIHHALNNGSVVRLDQERRVILQHRVHDYGLEHCAVKVVFSHSHRKQHGHPARAYGSIGENPYFTLWRVLDDSRSKATFTSFTPPATLPSGREFLGNITLDATHATQSPFFSCEAGSVQTLEIALACTSDPCIMEFRLTHSPKQQGFWVVQSEQKPTPS